MLHRQHHIFRCLAQCLVSKHARLLALCHSSFSPVTLFSSSPPTPPADSAAHTRYTGCTFSNNTAVKSTGGAAYLSSSVHPTFVRCRFENNTGVAGGAVAARDTAGGTFIDSIFKHCTATNSGGAVQATIKAILSFSGACLRFESYADDASLSGIMCYMYCV